MTLLSCFILCISLIFNKSAYFSASIFTSAPSEKSSQNYQNHTSGFIAHNTFSPLLEELNLNTPTVFSNTLIFGGDVMLSRYVDVKMWKNNDYTAPFENIAERFSQADIAFVNLESPLTPTPKHFSRGMQFGADVKSLAGLVHAGIDIVSLANNHFGDMGQKGMHYTLEQLQKHNIYQTGAGKNIGDANYPTFITKNGITFAFYAFSDISKNYSATETQAGFALRPDSKTLTALIHRAKRLADVVVISIHTGPEYKKYPQQEFVNFARESIDAGASLVIGHHPHVVQGVEHYNDGVIFYSLGNLIFDQYFPGTKEGLVAEVEFENETISNVTLLPVVIEDLWKSRFASEEEAPQILKKTLWE